MLQFPFKTIFSINFKKFRYWQKIVEYSWWNLLTWPPSREKTIFVEKTILKGNWSMGSVKGTVFCYQPNFFDKWMCFKAKIDKYFQTPNILDLHIAGKRGQMHIAGIEIISISNRPFHSSFCSRLAWCL